MNKENWERIAKESFCNPTEVYRHLPKGMLTNLYHKMSDRNIRNGFGSIPFTLDEFQTWAMSESKFIYIFDVWVNSRYDKNFKPSVDRTNPYKGYDFSNMSWMFWEDNKKKSYREVGDKKQRPILMLKNNIIIGRFKSVDDARYFLNMKSNGNISMCLAGRRKSVKGYQFIYENPELMEVNND
ncbi:hypothetical protein F6P74_06175 [Streptococcus suis]|uniref:hypothetical protein n=1 Tax=Streptococcus suis TaxID=1307 RepID=UPI001EE837FF|nr:hypothetical protein [Streptococcus suis]MBS8071114.1 hypothetical protein [Streptococcus suis]MBS8103619.1 hypothetical protein [Streptococcus suis]